MFGVVLTAKLAQRILGINHYLLCLRMWIRYTEIRIVHPVPLLLYKLLLLYVQSRKTLFPYLLHLPTKKMSARTLR
jgi:hypothetical protein